MRITYIILLFISLLFLVRCNQSYSSQVAFDQLRQDTTFSTTIVVTVEKSSLEVFTSGTFRRERTSKHFVEDVLIDDITFSFGEQYWRDTFRFISILENSSRLNFQFRPFYPDSSHIYIDHFDPYEYMTYEVRLKEISSERNNLKGGEVGDVYFESLPSENYWVRVVLNSKGEFRSINGGQRFKSFHLFE